MTSFVPGANQEDGVGIQAFMSFALFIIIQ